MKIKDFCNLLLIASGVLVSCSAVGQQYLKNALFGAVVGANEGMVKELLEKGANPNVSDYLGYTPLILAAGGGHKGVVKILLEKGANPNVRNTLGNTPLILAAERDHKGVVKTLLKKGADLNMRDKFGNTPLVLAVMGGCDGVVKTLLKKGADLNVRDEFGVTLLMLAARGGHEGVVKTLLEKGADPNMRDRFGRTLLTMAAERGNDDSMIRLLGKKGVPLPTEQQWKKLSEEAKEIILRNYPGTKERMQSVMRSWLEGEHKLPRDVARIITDERLPPDIYSVGPAGGSTGYSTEYPSGSGARNVDEEDQDSDFDIMDLA